MAARIDVSIEHKHALPEAKADGKPHPNTCPACGSHYRDDELTQHLNVCPQCGHHFPMRARARIASLADEGSFTEEAAELRSDDPLGFFDLRPYTERLAEAEVATGLGDAMVTGHATLDGAPFQLAVMDFAFMGGSMGRVVGEKFTRACEAAAEHNLPLVSVTASGGARMQEGILSLMQLPKTVCAVEDLHDAGGAMMLIIAPPASCRSSTAQTVFGSCISERIPSCIRAPPEAVTETRGRLCSAAASHARVNFSPTTRPIEPPMKAKSITASWKGAPSSVAWPVTIASPRPVATSASASRSVYGRRSKKPSGSSERSSAASSVKLPSSARLAIRARARIGKWWPHCGQTLRCCVSSSSR